MTPEECEEYWEETGETEYEVVFMGKTYQGYVNNVTGYFYSEDCDKDKVFYRDIEWYRV